MSSLDKLAIRGIRSFDHNELSVIQFQSPLTVIVGHNGSGKTTIIECLKYATTGDLPPNTKGGAFVHDPSIAGTSEVKASVKLRFINSRKEKMVVERRLQVTKKKTGVTGLTMKTLEGTISFVDKDAGDKKTRQSLSTKCAALDEEVPKQLGVSKAILENVIFCHQEESTWPLSEPAALKKKFDDIFEATKYTKALDQIKVLRKEQAVELKVDKEKLTALKTDKDRASKLRENIDRVSTSVDSKSGEHSTLDTKIIKIVKENKEFFNQASKHHDIMSKCETLRTQKGLIEENLAQVRSNLTEMKEDDAELEKRVEGFEEELVVRRTEREQTNLNLEDERDKLQTVEGRRSQAQMSFGRLQADKIRHEETIARRQTLVKELAGKHSIPGYDHDLTRDEITAFEDTLESKIGEKQKEIERLKKEQRDKEGEMQKLIQGLSSAMAADERMKRTVVEQIRAANSRIAKVNQSLDNCTTTVADITYAESSLAEEKRRRTELEDTIKGADYTSQLSKANRELRDLEEAKEKWHVELGTLNTQADVRAKLDLKKKERENKDKAIQSLLDKSAPTFKKFTKTEPIRDTMEATVNAELSTTDGDLSGKETTLRTAVKELQSVETSVTYAKKKLRDVNDEIAATKAKIATGMQTIDTDEKTIDAAVKEAEAEVDEAIRNVNHATNSTKFYERILKQGKAKKECIGCNRHIEKDEMEDFERWCQKQQEKNPAEIKQAKSEHDAWQTQLAKLRKLLPAEIALNKLVGTDLPAAESEVEKTNEKIAPAAAFQAEATASVEELRSRIKELQLLKKTAGDVMRMHREVVEVGREIAKHESELSATGSSATTGDIQKEIALLGDKIRHLKSSVEKLRTDNQKQNATLQSLSNSIHSSEMELSGKKQEIKEKDNLEKQKDAERAEITRLEGQLNELAEKVHSATAPIQKHQDELSELQSSFAQKESTTSRELQAYNKSAETLERNAREIQNYQNRGGAAALEKCEKEVEQHEKTIKEIKFKVTQLQNALSKADKDLADSNAVLRNMKDNQQFRKSRKEIERIDNEIDSLDEASAKKAYRKFDEDYNARRKTQSDWQAMQARLGGEIETLKADLAAKKKELKDEYDNIDDKYRIELIKVKTTETANNDLEKYAKALDSAIMMFHGAKMKEINESIADLWQKTYQGTDIDKIMIKSDAEGKGAGGRSYNYRVVMFKDNTEMDMRGRCSAGQKVLACIIIRLALADSFSVNCGILALDEPTTNLDQANIDSLGNALAELIKERRAQANFQLIVITHDENFLTILGGSGSFERFWRVIRSDGGLTSNIVRERLT